MGREGIETGEGLGASRVPAGGRAQPPLSFEERKRKLRRKIALWGTVSVLLAAGWGYATFWQLVPAVKAYRALIAERVQLGPRAERLQWKSLGKAAEGSPSLLAVHTAPMPAAVAEALAQGRQPVGRLTLAVIRHGQVVARYGPYFNTIVSGAKTNLRDCFNNNAAAVCTGTISTLKFHGIGTAAGATSSNQTALTTELTTQYNPDNTRATGSQTTNGTNVYRTVGTNTVDATATIAEWGLFNQAATGGGNMWSRVEISPTIGLNSGDSLQTTYDLTLN